MDSCLGRRAGADKSEALDDVLVYRKWNHACHGRKGHEMKVAVQSPLSNSLQSVAGRTNPWQTRSTCQPGFLQLLGEKAASFKLQSTEPERMSAGIDQNNNKIQSLLKSKGATGTPN